MRSEYILEARAVSKHYRKGKGYFCANHGISLGVRQGEMVCVVGPSGCGKSTLLKTLSGIHRPSEGSVVFDGTEYENGVPTEVRKRIGVVFQTDNLLPWRSVGDNLRLSLELLSLRGAEWERKIDEKLEMVGLLDYKHALPHELSGGMRQRAGIARALVHEPDLLLMDQPFSALDAITKKIISHFFLDMWKETGKSVLFITNNVAEAVLLGSRIYVLSACPATVCHEVDAAALPVEARGREVEKNPEFQRLKHEIRSLVVRESTRREGEAG